MRRIVLDIETTISYPFVDNPKEKDGSAYNPDNRLVSVGVLDVDTGESDYLFFNHDEVDVGTRVESDEKLREWLDKATLIIGHNLKFDLAWLRECGYDYNGPLYDTMFFEYVMARGRRVPLKLSECAERHSLPVGKLDILEHYFAQGVNTDEIPYDELLEYGMRDIEVTRDLYLHQINSVDSDKKQKMLTAINLMNDFLPVLTDMERAGAAIDLQLLEEFKEKYSAERDALKIKLETDLVHFMGERPYSLGSPDDMNKVIYSRGVKSKDEWKETFGIGSSQRGAVKKKNSVRMFSNAKFKGIVQKQTKVVYKEEANCCPDCKGSGKQYKLTKSGEPYKVQPKCKTCGGTGVVYISTGKVAGLKLKPHNKWVTANGFSVGADAVEEYTESDAMPEASRAFITNMNRYNKLNVWVDSFIHGIKKYQKDGILHANFNQCIAATGRLTCNKPNMQNQSKHEKSFPIRKVFVSRWKDKGGVLYDADFGQLEFKIAAFLSQCPDAIAFIEKGEDIHSWSRAFWAGELDIQPPEDQIRPDITRQEAKAETFGPLYGKQTAWTEQFYKMFPGIHQWHKNLMEEAVTTKETITPSGRVYAFPEAKRFTNKKGELLVSGHTQIKNYSVQGFATGDMVLLVLIDIYDYLMVRGANSKLILQVHDSVTVDTHPDEEELVISAFKHGFDNIYKHAKERFGIDINVSLDFELSKGVNWLEQEEISLS